ncbi:hypothetical protein [Acinetobacter bereziniae]|uniref:hypothetical protein n=1 Tax=Acinetobacter bereziniae TaxID=106648 RepID=UPI000574F7E4|nr:hypothetical protein [Acinetobacter bereziniae]CEI54450.1 hypothetical protein [Acinetobacter bereziniae]
MTNRLEIKWKLDGFVDEQRYYCSETPLDISNLPDPKVILDAEARSYVDTEIEADRTYFLVIGSVKNNTEKMSDNKFVSTFKIGSLIDQIFVDGSKGCAYDFNDLSTMYQDKQKTIKVTDINQPVGFVFDKSGNGNNLISDGGDRPILKKDNQSNSYYLSFDNNKYMECQNLNLSGSTEINVFHGINIFNSSSTQVFSELSADYNNYNGSFIFYKSNSDFIHSMRSPYSVASAQIQSTNKCVISSYSNRLNQSNKIEYIRINKSNISLIRQLDGTTGNFENNRFFIGARAGNQFYSNSDFYSFILICKKLEMSKVEEIELSISTLMGI